MGNYMKSVDATPTKNIYSSIIADYDMRLGICELIDNVIDSKIRRNIKDMVKVNIDFDFRRSIILISDNAGGVKEDDLKLLVSPGQSENDSSKQTIGLFGVGSKRAVVSIAEDIRVTTRFNSEDTYRVKYDEEWLKSTDWNIEYGQVEDIEPKTTIIELSRLRILFTENDLPALKKDLALTYGYLLRDMQIEIIVNQEKIKPEFIDKWAFPPDYLPKEINGALTVNSKNVNVRIQVGLFNVSNAQGEHGITVYCNKRLVEKNINSETAGFFPGNIGRPHPSISLANAIVFIEGPADVMPWNSSKSKINVSSEVFRDIYSMYIDQLKAFASLSRRLEGRWEEQIFKYDQGKFQKIDSTKRKEIKQYTPELPKVRQEPIDIFKKKNHELEYNKPWLVGVHEGILAVDKIGKIKISTKNRLSLIVLDSTLEIAFKEYLIKESGKHFSDTKLKEIMSKRHVVHQEMMKFLPKLHWDKIKYYYSMRCKLIHERASVEISDRDIKLFKEVVEESVTAMFETEF